MQLPIVSPAPLVTIHAETFADLFENQCQFRHFQNYLTGHIGFAQQEFGKHRPVHPG